MIRTTYEPGADVPNVEFRPTDAAGDGRQEVAPGVYAEFDRAAHPIGIEVTSVHLRRAAGFAAVATDAAE